MFMHASSIGNFVQLTIVADLSSFVQGNNGYTSLGEKFN